MSLESSWSRAISWDLTNAIPSPWPCLPNTCLASGINVGGPLLQARSCEVPSATNACCTKWQSTSGAQQADHVPIEKSHPLGVWSPFSAKASLTFISNSNSFVARSFSNSNNFRSKVFLRRKTLLPKLLELERDLATTPTRSGQGLRLHSISLRCLHLSETAHGTSSFNPRRTIGFFSGFALRACKGWNLADTRDSACSL